ncbi:TetR/AcrR family transcriptional regulator [Vallitalea pronyensis]|uniref:TetR/AcrR family transcriptional regulator n=1 Tax=Vallitalea pronyensis TaxID=1348613 RepID=A0A8J8MHU4_9FIRM|nr:TetR/AcrR family transcriptional regulator [Vallitalea pronyensis]QUI21874.1 TetR/AcrR family transcriptional regulator [Vallitalea pronyensis]
MMIKQRIIIIALSEMLDKGIEHITIKKMAQKTGLNEDRLNDFFLFGDKELLMDVIEYAGEKWVHEIKASIHKVPNKDQKLNTLIYGYTMGSKKYPQSLSTYIDLWKLIKDKQDEYIKMRLKTIYNFYIAEFTHIVQDMGYQHIPYNALIAFGIFLTLISDVVHIQSLILDNKLDYDYMYRILNKLTKQFLIGEIV